jgi:hypothetical protein
MNAKLIVTSAVLALALGMATPAFAQDQTQGDKQDQPKAQQKAQKQQNQNDQKQAKQQQKTQQQQNQNDQKQAKQQQKAQQQQNQNNQKQAQQQQKGQHQQNQDNQKQAKQQQKAEQQQNQNDQKQAQQQQQQPQRTDAQQREEQTTWQNHRAGNWQSDHRSWQQRGGYNGYRVPDDRYSVYFGQRNVFRIYGLPFMVFDGYPRFQYNGYWITLLDPWPGNWSNDWYDTDNVYVLYENDGYYLYDDRYPGIGIAVSISM